LSHKHEWEGKKEKVDNEVRSNDDRDKLPGRVEWIVSHEDGLDSDCIFRSDSLGKFLALATEFG
jgi:hypothetical protein